MVEKTGSYSHCVCVRERFRLQKNDVDLFRFEYDIFYIFVVNVYSHFIIMTAEGFIRCDTWMTSLCPEVQSLSPMYGFVPAIDVAFKSSFTMAAMLKSVRWAWPAQKNNRSLLYSMRYEIDVLMVTLLTWSIWHYSSLILMLMRKCVVRSEWCVSSSCTMHCGKY